MPDIKQFSDEAAMWFAKAAERALGVPVSWSSGSIRLASRGALIASYTIVLKEAPKDSE